MKKIKLLLYLFFSLFSMHSQVLINEFEPNPSGTDSPNQSIELKGAPNTSFSGVIISVEGDRENSRKGTVEGLNNVSGDFDANGLLVISIPDLENPSFTLILLDIFSGSVGDTVDPTAIQANVLDAIGVADTVNDLPELIADDLGGVNLVPPNTTEPTLLFRDSLDNSIYVVINSSIYNGQGEMLSISEFDGDPTIPSFGIENRSNNGVVLSISSLDINKKLVNVYPNPVKEGEVILNTNINGTINVEVFTFSGKKILSFYSKNKIINLQDLEPGKYVVKFRLGNQQLVSRIVVL